MMVVKPQDKDEAIFLHPGEPVFERLRAMVASKFAEDAARGAVFIDADAASPYMLHFATATVIRRANPELQGLEQEELLDTRLVAVKHGLDGALETCAAENLLLLRSSAGVPVDAMRFAATAGSSRERAKEFIVTTISQPMADRHRREMAELPWPSGNSMSFAGSIFRTPNWRKPGRPARARHRWRCQGPQANGRCPSTSAAPFRPP